MFILAVLTLTAGGLQEFFSMVEKKGIAIYKTFGIFLGLLIPLSIIFKFELTKSWELFFFVLALLGIFVLQFTRQDNAQAIVAISTTMFGILYVSWLFSFLIKIRYLPDGVSLLAALVIITKASDLGAYLVGITMGRHALISRISPHKSVEGALGGIIFSVLAALLCQWFLRPIRGVWHLVTLGAFLGVLAQLGDLSESLIKRDCLMKDSGGLFPGMGGVLDIIDSILFTAPTFYFHLSVFLK
jgi:phosphatidate cytidylyltransferase